MFLKSIMEILSDKFIIRKTQIKNSGYINKLIFKVSRGHTLWESKSYNIVLPYGFILTVDVFLMTTVILKIFLHPEELNLFKSTLDIGFMGAILIFCSIHIPNGKIEEELSIAVDGWWTYVYLDNETAEIKKNIQRRLEFITRIFINTLSCGGICYTMLPVFKYLYNGVQQTEDLLVVEGLVEVPWIYLEILSGALIVPICCTHTAYFIANMTAISFTHIAQLQLAGLAFTTIETRVKRTMGNSKQTLLQFEEIFDYLVQNEIKSCAKHYHAIYRQTIKMYELKARKVNHIFYMGCCCITTMGVLITKEKEISFLLIQVIALMVSLTGGMCLIAYPLDSVIDAVEEFRIQVYGSSWYNFPLNCQKSVLLMQTTLLHAPKCKTLMGSEVTIEFLAKIFNASYYYITTILSMESK